MMTNRRTTIRVYGNESMAMNRDILGKYIHEKTGSHYLELKPDGNCFLFEGSAGVTGVYEVNGSEITISSAESTARGKIQDGVIIDSDGDQWIRAKGTEEATTNYSKCHNCNSDVLETAQFCSHCGAQVNATGGVPPIPINRKVRIATQATINAPKESARDSTTISDDPLASISWLPAILRKDDFPWELIEAAGAVVVLVVLFAVAISGRP
jgi:hypothetical protein